jgi:hypothetical protein
MTGPRRAVLAAVLALLGMAAIAVATAQPGGDGAVGQPEAGALGVRFGYVDVFIDSGERELAVYQVELRATAGDVRIVGVEGGDPAAFAGPPRYDPAALADGERIVIGDFSTGAVLPSGSTRIARVHLRLDGPPPALELTLAVAGDEEGERISTTVSYTTSFQTQKGSDR